LTAALSLLGLLIAYLVFLRRVPVGQALTDSGWGRALARWWLEGWGMDRLYGMLFVRPFLRLARANKEDWIEQAYRFLAWLCRLSYGGLHATQTGQVRWYAAVLASGSVMIVALVMWL
jgi:NADH-quinone oxidoreductase subunit L